jgi:serine/threonine-protein kinase
MSPEQAFGQSVDRRTDIYALAIVLWEMLTMQRMFKANNDLALLDEVRNPTILPPSAYSPELPPELDRVVLRALSRDPAGRPSTARELRRELQEAFPAAAAVGEERLGEVVCAVLGEHIELRRLSLPDSVVGLNVRSLEQKSDIARNEVLRTMTVSAPGARYAADHEVSEPRLPAGQGVGPAGSAPGHVSGPGRLVVIGAGVVTLAAAAAAGVAIALSAPSPTQPTVTALEPAPAVTPLPSSASPSVPVTPAVSSAEADAGAAALADGEDPSDDEEATRGEPGRRRGVRRGPRGPRPSPPAMDEDGVRVIRRGGVTIYDDSY